MTTEQRDLDVIFQVNNCIYKSKQNVKRDVLAALNAAVPNKYKRAIDHHIGVANYKQTKHPVKSSGNSSGGTASQQQPRK